MKFKILLVLSLIPFFASAATTWVGPAMITTAAWNTPSNWSPSGIPTSSEAITFTTAVTISDPVPSTSSNNITITGTGSVTIATGNIVAFGNIDMDGGTLVVNGTLNAQNVNYPVAGGTITNNGMMTAKNLNIGTGAQAGTFINNGSLAVAQDIVVFEGTFDNNSGGTVVTNGFDIKSGGTILNGGSFESLGNSSTAQGTIAAGGTFTNEAGGILDLDIMIGNVPAMNIQGVFTNAGTINVGNMPYNPNSQGIRIGNNGTMTNTGSVIFSIDPGNCVFINNGTLSTVSVTIISGSNCLNTLLPVKLISFAANRTVNCDVQFSWKVAGSEGLQYFEIQRNTWGNKFITIDTVYLNDVPGFNYNFIDKANTGSGNYRLLMLGTDGSSTYSNIISVQSCLNTTIALYPNPVTDYINISGLKAGQSIRVINTAGQIVIIKIVTRSKEMINLSHLPHGVYNIAVDNSTHQIIKQ